MPERFWKGDVAGLHDEVFPIAVDFQARHTITSPIDDPIGGSAAIYDIRQVGAVAGGGRQ